MFGSNINNEFYKSTVCFMIIWLKKNVPCVVKVATVTFINSELLKDELLNCLELLITGGFNVRAVIFDNHAANVSAFTKLMLQFGEDNESLFINFQSQMVYLFYNTVHLIRKNSDTVVKIIVSMIQKQHQQLMSISIFCREVDFTIRMPCDLCLWLFCVYWPCYKCYNIFENEGKSCYRTSPQCCDVSWILFMFCTLE